MDRRGIAILTSVELIQTYPQEPFLSMNLVTEMYHKSYSLLKSQWRSGWQKLALFFSFTNLCFTY